MQAYPRYGYNQETYVYVEDDDIMKGDYFYDHESNVHMVSPNEWIPAPPYAPPHHGSYYQGMKHGKESYWTSDKEQYHHRDGWQMDKPSHGGGWPNDKYQHHQQDSWEMDKPSHGWPNEIKQHQHHESWNMDKPSHGWPNDKEQHRHHESWSMDKPSHGGKKHDGGYDYGDDMSHLKMGGSVTGSGHHAPPRKTPVVLNKQYGDDCENQPYYSEHKKDVLWDFKGIDD